MGIKSKYNVKYIDHYLTHEWLLYKHYARRIPNIVYSFGLYDNDNILQGIMTMGMPPTPFFNKLFGQHKYLELNRLCVNDGLEKNVLSFFVSMSLKMLKEDVVIVSYADPNNGHNGYIYQATNWIYTGAGRVNENDERGVNRFFINDKEYHERHIVEKMKSLNFKLDNTKTKNENWIFNGGKILKQDRKHRYFFICGKRKYKNEIQGILNSHFKIQAYPKGNNNRYDATYNPTIQIQLF